MYQNLLSTIPAAIFVSFLGPVSDQVANWTLTRRHPCKNFSALNNSEMQKEGSLLQTKSAK